MEHVAIEGDSLSKEGMSKCKVPRESLGEQTASVLVEKSTRTAVSSLSTGHSDPQKQTDQQDDNARQRERPQGQGSCVPSSEASAGQPRAVIDSSLRPSGTPLRLRRLPASFWQEPNVPKDSSGKLMSTDGCFGSCSCHLHRHPFQNDAPFEYGDYDIRTGGLRSKYLDPVSPSGFARPGHGFASLSKFSGDPLELAYASAVPWPQGPVVSSFPPVPAAAVVRGDMIPVFIDRPGSTGRTTSFSATAALYGHMMRRSLHGNYHHSNDVLADRLASPIVTDDLWRLLPNRPLMNDFSKRFHPYL